MNRKWIIPLVGAVASGVLAFIVTRFMVCDTEKLPLDCLQDASILVRTLDLSESQAREIRALHAKLGPQLNDCCTRHCAARARLGTAIASETSGTDQAESILSEMCLAYEQSERATLNHIRAVRAVLNAKQRRQFDELIMRRVCDPREKGNCAASAMGGANSCNR